MLYRGRQNVNTQTLTREVDVLTLKQIAHALHDRKLKMVARETGLHYHTIRRLALQEDANPKLSTIMRITEYLNREPGE